MQAEPNFTPPSEEVNIERLLRHAAQPEPVDPLFLERVEQRLLEVAADRSRTQRRRARRRALTALAACVIAGLGVLMWSLKLPVGGSHPRPSSVAPVTRAATGDILARPTPRKLETVGLGATVRTGAGERRRVRLPDDTVLTLNENTEIHCPTTRRLTLKRGEVFVEVSPRAPEKDGSTFAVQAAGRAITAFGTRFAVRAAEKDARVLVTQGKVRVEGLAGAIQTGEQWTTTDNQIAPAPRASHVLAWAREALAACETPLIPPSAYAGGALVAHDASGQEQRLSLRKYHVDVQVENGFVRTTIDQTYFNHQWGRLEGTFFFPLPADASLSRLAMYVDGTLNEGGMVERDYGRSVYESIVRKMQDPALLEWVDGTTFKMRVFPLEGRQEKRIILCYTQKLAGAHGTHTYRFPAGHSLEKVGEWSFQARIKNGLPLVWHSPSHALEVKKDNTDLVLATSTRQEKLERDVVIELSDPRQAPDSEQTAFATVEHEGAHYLLLRHRPHLAVTRAATPPHRHWVFLFEHGHERDSVVARAQIEILRTLLTHIEHDDTFTVLAANQQCRALTPEPVPATAPHIERVLAELEQLPLIGAFDMETALKTAATQLQSGRQSVLVHLGTAQPRLGERTADRLALLLPTTVPYVGVGVGKHWSRTLMKRLADRSGGFFTQINPDELIAWRGFDLLATLNMPRLLDVQVQAEGETLTFLSDASTIAQGEEYVAIARLGDKQAMPKQLVVTGTLEGKTRRQVLPVRQVIEAASYLPRHWCKLEIDRLLAENASGNKERIVQLSKALYVMSPYTSLLVLENAAMYQQFKVEQGKPEIWAPYVTPKQIPVVFEPLPGQQQPRTEGPRSNDGKRPADVVCQTVLQQIRPSFVQVSQNIYNQLWAEGTWGALPQMDLYMLSETYNDLSFRETNGTVRGLRVPSYAPMALPELRTKLYILAPMTEVADESRWKVRHFAYDLAPQSFSPNGRRFTTPTIADFRQPFHYYRQILPTNGIDGVALWDYKYLNDGWTRFGTYRIRPQRERTERDRRLEPAAAHPLLYQRPYLADSTLLYRNLLLHAPGLNSTPADLQGILDAEATTAQPTVKGNADPRVQGVLERARRAGWSTVTIPATTQQAAYTITFDATGRYHWKRTLPNGLQEEVVCDGTNLWHLYPEIGLGAQRVVNRALRSEFADEVPAYLPPLEELLHGADVMLVDDHTLAIIGHTGSQDIHYILDAEGKFSERRLIERKTRQTVRTDKLTVTSATAPALTPDLSKLVVLPLPVRSWAELLRVREHPKGYADATLPVAHRLALVAAATFEHRSEEQRTLIRTFTDKGDRRSGFFTLLAACERIPDQFKFTAAKDAPGPLGVLLETVATQEQKDTREADEAAAEHFCHLLLRMRQLERLSEGRTTFSSQERDRLLAQLARISSPELLWAVAQGFMVLDKPKGELQQLAVAVLDCVRKKLVDVPLLGLASQHEWGLALAAVDPEAGRRALEEFHRDSIRARILPPADARLQGVLGTERWSALMRSDGAALCKAGHPEELLILLQQVELLGQQALAGELREMMIHNCKNSDKYVPVTRVAIDQLRSHQRYAEAERLVEQLLTEKSLENDAELWHLAATVAQENEHIGKAVRYLEKALELDWARTEVQQARVRQAYSLLLNYYQQQIHAARQLDIPSPVTTDRALRAIERWRKLDPHPEGLKQSAFLLATLGENDRAWAYLTTALGTAEATQQSWQQASQELTAKRQFELARRAATEASHLETMKK